MVMSNGYQFESVEDTKSVRQFMNLDEVRNHPTIEGGKIATIHIAQDDKEEHELQSDTRLKYDVYDNELATKTGNKRGVDSSVVLNEEQWNRILDDGDLVEGRSYEYLDRETGLVSTSIPSYLSYQSDIVLKHEGPQIITNSIERMDPPLDIEKHGDRTSNKLNENSPAEQARNAIAQRELEDESSPASMTFEEFGAELASANQKITSKPLDDTKSKKKNEKENEKEKDDDGPDF